MRSVNLQYVTDILGPKVPVFQPIRYNLLSPDAMRVCRRFVYVLAVGLAVHAGTVQAHGQALAPTQDQSQHSDTPQNPDQIVLDGAHVRPWPTTDVTDVWRRVRPKRQPS